MLISSLEGYGATMQPQLNSILELTHEDHSHNSSLALIVLPVLLPKNDLYLSSKALIISSWNWPQTELGWADE